MSVSSRRPSCSPMKMVRCALPAFTPWSGSPRKTLLMTEREMKAADIVFAVVHVLAGFVRERTNRADYPPRPKREYYPFALPDTGDQDVDASEEKHWRRRAGGWGAPTEPVKAAIAALSNLCLQEHELSGSTIADRFAAARNCRVWKRRTISCENGASTAQTWRCAFLICKSNCYGADFDRANLQQAVLTGADIRHGTFDDADLSYSSLIQSKAERASFQKSTLYGARLDIANFQRARMVSAKMANVSLITTDLRALFLTGPICLTPFFMERRLATPTCTRPKTSRRNNWS